MSRKSWVCTTVSHEQSTQSNWLNYFVGFTPLKERLFADIDSNPDFGQIKPIEPAAALPALPPGDNTTFDSDDNEEIPPY